MPTELIVRHCAPTLAGLKIGNLFSSKFNNIDNLLRMVNEQNKKLNQKGVYLILLRIHNGNALGYLYRKNQLINRLAENDIKVFLSQFGYTDFSIEASLNLLSTRLSEDEFPHEIGVFLGYPLVDIKAFIKNKGANCPCVGCWKAYNNIKEAEKTFATFKKCTEVYCQQYTDGIDITRLTVAG